MDAFQLLKADHQKVAQLFDQLESASGRAKLQVFEQIKTELELHTHIEETFFYPALEKPTETHDLVLESYEEHDVVKKLLQELSRARTANDEWEAQAKVLRENVEHHVEEEENELFPKAEDVLSEDDIEGLGDQMAAEKRRKQGRQSTKSRGAGKAAKKSAGSTKKAAGGAKKGRSSKKAAKKTSKKSGTKKSASKSASRSTATKTARKSRSKKSGSKKSGSKKSGSKKR